MRTVERIATVGDEQPGNVDVERSDGADDEQKDQGRAQQRQGQMTEALPGVGPVDRRRLVHGFRDGLEPGQRHNGHPAESLPDF